MDRKLITLLLKICQKIGVLKIYPVERRKTGIWTYTKWSDGYCEAEAYVEGTSTFNTAAGGLFESSIHQANLPANLFKTVNPIAFANVATSNGATAENPRATTTAVSWYMLNITRQTSAIQTQTIIKVTGTWK